MTNDNESPTPAPQTFRDLALPETVLRALDDVGYESPSPIQAATIPPLLEGRDVLGQAQTGTGKTAAFALPVLARIDPARRTPQALVLTPTRELAIQVAEAFQRYAAHLPQFQILPIYGGQGYGPQLSALRRGVHVVVGTPGRVIDHMNRGTLDLSALDCLVLDEADEMLRMGFVDDVEAVLEKTPPTRQIALFSATMPAPIRRIAQTHLKDPVEITIKSKTQTAANIRQRYWAVSGLHKLDALTRILEAETFDAMIIFARTKQATEELAEKLAARGLSAAAINGDIPQQQRERTIQRLKDGQLDILVATDVAARGLDVERISHVLNYDIPYDTEAYVHRIGRTGRAGRSGEAILFVTPRERGMLRAIERATRQPIESMVLPTVEAVNDQRIVRFKQRITDALTDESLDLYRQLVDSYEREHNVPANEIAAALARIVQGETPLLLDPDRKPQRSEQEKWAARRETKGEWQERDARGSRDSRSPREGRPERPRRDESNASSPRPAHFNTAPAAAPRPEPAERPAPHTIERLETTPAATRDHVDAPRERPSAERPPRERSRAERPRGSEEGKETFRIEVGHAHGVKPANIVGAIANEAGLDSAHIGRIDIRDDHSFVDLPEGMPGDVFKHLKKVWVSGQQLRITRASEEPEARDRFPRKPRSDRPTDQRPGNKGFARGERGKAPPKRR
ncbi:DEAD/DEAH box helicase [Tahibacter amnicola]|uniref:ATP-dependent RNA helicase DeaD n=1 Tax=Tahibacter amnicola TaxID=2976241 RepID=A0ABY6BBF6_9GAMM|nr:DEAD/DEAH box helicase [Tahibacter amnicola]UXI66871.1 DEAD/DEAH box helicase [Tahibacter amnicola]